MSDFDRKQAEVDRLLADRARIHGVTDDQPSIVTDDPPDPKQETIDKLLADLEALGRIKRQAQSAQNRRDQIFLQLRDLGVTQVRIAAAYGALTEVGVSNTFKRLDAKEHQ